MVGAPGERACPQCGAALGLDAPEGLCPGCLLKAGLVPDADTAPGGWTPPSVESLNPLSEDLEVVRRIGQGGMGAVYEARQKKLDRRVALKVLRPELGEEPGFPERLAREARALAKLAHQNVVGIHDFGKAGTFHYVVMEYVDGQSLRQLLQAGRIDPGRAAQIAIQICSGLRYAHDQGVIHRDIKPENVLVDTTGRVRIADFGLAKLSAGARGDTLTGTHDVMGTIHYMAPEQLERPGAVDHRSDLYALGVVLYEMLTGQLPMGRFPPPSQRTGTLTHLDDIVLKLLERDSALRYDSAASVLLDLERRVPLRPSAPGEDPRPAVAARASDVRRPCLWVLAAGIIGFVAMFLPWMSVSESKLDEWAFGKGRDVFGDKSSPGHPFFKRDGRPEREVRLTFKAWDTNLFDIPNGLLGIVSAALALLAAITLGSAWRASWLAYVLPTGYGLLHSGCFLVSVSAVGGSPAVGCLMTVLVFVACSVAAWAMRPPGARHGHPTAALRRIRSKRRRKDRKPASARSRTQRRQ